MDSQYWNANLRSDSKYDFDDDTNKFPGLVTLSCSGNKITGKGIILLARFLRDNHWLQGKQA